MYSVSPSESTAMMQDLYNASVDVHGVQMGSGLYLPFFMNLFPIPPIYLQVIQVRAHTHTHTHTHARARENRVNVLCRNSSLFFVLFLLFVLHVPPPPLSPNKPKTMM